MLHLQLKMKDIDVMKRKTQTQSFEISLNEQGSEPPCTPRTRHQKEGAMQGERERKHKLAS